MTRDNMAYGEAAAWREHLDAVWAAIDAGEEIDGQDAYEHLDEMVLELVWEMGEPFAVVLGTGGPHSEITGGGRSGGYVLTVYWGGDRSDLRGESITRTGEYFREMVDQ